MKKFARINAIACIVTSAVCLFFFLMFAFIVDDGMFYSKTATSHPTPLLFLFAAISAASLVVALFQLDAFSKKPSPLKTLILTIASFVVAWGGFAIALEFGIGVNVNSGMFVVIGYMEFFISLLFLASLLISGILLPILIYRGDLLD